MIVTATPTPTPSPSQTTGGVTTTSTTPTPTPTPKVQVSGFGGLIVAALLSGAVVAAAVAATVNVWLARRKSREEDRARVRTTLAEAFQAYAAYKEFPYAIRRRRADVPAEERVRLSEALRGVQARLCYYEAWTSAEHESTGIAYKTLVTQVRIIAGGSMREGWTQPALDNDPGMNIGPDVVDLSELNQYEQAFIEAAAAHVEGLGLTWWQRRKAARNAAS